MTTRWAVTFGQEGQIIGWTPSLVIRMILFRVDIAGRLIPRRDVLRRLWHVYMAWFQWTTALPGDRFYDLSRDCLIEVRGGLPGRRRAAYVAGFLGASRYPVVDRMRLDALFALCPTEPCLQEWWRVERV